MMFISYSAALAVLGFAYEWPDTFLLVALALASRKILWNKRGIP